MRHPCLWFLTILASALAWLPAISFAGETNGYQLFFNPQSVDTSDVPADLAQQYPDSILVSITFKPATRAAGKDGSSLQAGEGSWPNRGMHPTEPGKIEFIIPKDDPKLLVHTLKTSAGPFIFRVKNTRQGYLATVPFASPQLDLAAQANQTTQATQAPVASATPTPAAAAATGADTTGKSASDTNYSAVPVTQPIPSGDGVWMYNTTLNDWTWADMNGWQYIRNGGTWKWNGEGQAPAAHPATPNPPEGGFPNTPPPSAGGPATH